MDPIDEAAVTNEAFWGREVAKGGGHTIPWLDLDVDELRRYARGDLGEARIVGRNDPSRMVNVSPCDLIPLAPVEGKDVLCLSCGGGQQSALFSLLGAHVTVVDITQGQLDGDREAAEHFGYDVRTVHADARDLSVLAPDSIDIVYAMTPCYVPSVRDIYAQVSRVLRPGGMYRTDMGKPGLFSIEWSGKGYHITKPYAEPTQTREDGAVEFRHYLDDIFNGLLDNGLTLTRVEDRARFRLPAPDVRPGSYAHESAYLGGGFVVFAMKVAE